MSKMMSWITIGAAALALTPIVSGQVPDGITPDIQENLKVMYGTISVSTPGEMLPRNRKSKALPRVLNVNAFADQAGKQQNSQIRLL